MLWGVFLLPVLAALFVSAWEVLKTLPGSSFPLGPVLGGVAGYGIFQRILNRPIQLYVFGHELTHAFAAWLSGYRVRSFSVSARGGAVVLSGSNVWVALAPYCIPLYTVFSVVILNLLSRSTRFGLSPSWGAFIIGFTFAFHGALTVYALRQHQPDLHTVGPFLSMVIILMANCLVFIFLLKIIFPSGVSLASFLSGFFVSYLGLMDLLSQAAGAGFHILTERFGDAR